MKLQPSRGAISAAWLLWCLCLLWGLGLLAWVLLQEPPQAALKGTVTVRETGQPLPAAKVLLRGCEGPAQGQMRRAKTDAQGKFAFAHLPIGRYEIQATSRSDIHALPPMAVELREGDRKNLLLELAPQRTFLELLSPQHTFTTREKAKVGVHGFVDADTLFVDVARFDLRRWLTADPAHRNQYHSSYYGWPDYEIDALRRGGYLHPLPRKKVPLTERDEEGVFTQYVDLPVREPGAYLAEFTLGRHTQRLGLLVSNLALVVKEDGRNMLLLAADLDSGEPLPRTEMTVYPPLGKEPLSQGQTDAQGLFQAAIPPNQGGDYLVMGQRGPHFSVVNFYVSPQAEERYRVHLYTERPIYRPGHRVRFKGILRQVTPDGYRVPPPRAVTVEVRDARGHLVWRETPPSPPLQRGGVRGGLPLRKGGMSPPQASQGGMQSNAFGSFWGEFDVPKEAAAGLFDLVALIDGEEHHGQFAVASYRKPECELKLSSDKPYYLPGEKARITLEARYYFGTPVAQAEVSYSVYRHPTYYRPPSEESEVWEEEGYEEGAEDYGEWLLSEEVQTDADGRAVLTLDPARIDRKRKKENKEPPEPVGGGAVGRPAPSDDEWEPTTTEWQYDVDVELVDASGKYVYGDTSFVVVPAAFFLDAQPDSYFIAPGQEITVRLEAKSYDGQPQARTELRVAVGRAEWREESSGQWRRTVEPGREATVRTDEQGQATFAFTPDEEGEWIVRAQATDRQKNPVGTATTLYVWAGGERLPNYPYGKLELNLDKPRYHLGETARAVFNVDQPSGRALVTVEGDRLYEHRLLELKTNTQTADFPVKAAYLPNVFIGAARVRQKRLEQRTTVLQLATGQRVLQVQITPDRTTVHPREQVTYTVQVTDADGRPVRAEVSLAVVDESIYALRADHPEEIIETFYARRSNRVNTYFSAPEVYLQEGKDTGTPVRKEFPDTAFWKPDLRTDAKGQATITVTLPDTLTTWRATAIAHAPPFAKGGLGGVTSVGYGTAKVVSRLDFQVRLETPRFFTQGDEAVIAAIVHNDTDRAEKVTVQLDAPGLEPVAKTTKTRRTSGAKSRSDGWPTQAGQVPAHGSRRFAWPGRIGPPGEMTFTVSAQARSGWRDAVQRTVPVVPYAVVQHTSESGELRPGEVVETVTMTPDTLPEVSQVEVTLSPSIAGTVLQSLDYLVHYPYGCVEQTMSSFLPDVMVAQAWEKLKWPRQRPMREQLPDMVAHGLLRLYNYQHYDGGWGWWEYDGTQMWMTAYVVYGLQECRRAGFEVDSDVFNRGLRWLKEGVKHLAPSQTPTRDQCFALYLLAREKQDVRKILFPSPPPKERPGARAIPAPPSVPARLLRSSPPGEGGAWGGDIESLALTALALHEIGRPEEARPLIQRILAQASEDRRSCHWSDVETTAWALRALLRYEPENEVLPKVVHWLRLQWNGQAWLSTKATSLTIAALLEYLQARQWAPPQGSVRVALNGETLEEAKLTPDSVFQPDVRWPIPASQLRQGKNEIRLMCAGTGQLYYTVAFHCYLKVDEMPQRLSATGLRVERRYDLVERGHAGTTEFRPLPGDKPCRQGSVIRGEILLSVDQPRQYVLVEEPLPAGCEVLDQGDLEEYEWRDLGYWWTSRDVRDDRIAFFITDLSPGQHKLFYTLRAEQPGAYRVLPTYVEGMYEPELHNSGSEAVVQVRP